MHVNMLPAPVNPDGTPQELTASDAFKGKAALLAPDEQARHAVALLGPHGSAKHAPKHDAASPLNQNEVSRLDALEFCPPDEDEIAASNPGKQRVVIYKNRAEAVASNPLRD